MPVYFVQSAEVPQDRAITASSFMEAVAKYMDDAPRGIRFAKGILVSSGRSLKSYVVKDHATGWVVEVPLEEVRIKPTGLMRMYVAKKVGAGSPKKPGKKAPPKRR